MDLIIVPFHDFKKWIYEGFRTRDAHLFEHFVKSQKFNKILVINRPVSPVEMIVKRRSWHVNTGKLIKKSRNFRLTEVSENVFCLDFIVFDFIKVLIQKKYWWFSCFSYPIITDTINQCMDFLNMKDNVLFLQNPMSINVAKKIKNINIFAFDAIDNWLVHPQMAQIHDIISANYKYVDCHADLIFTVSENLLHIFKQNKNKYWIPNGVDLDFFSSARSTQKKDRFCIGYIGKIQERVDFVLIEECLKRFRDVDFVFLGPVLSQKNQVNILKKHYNNIKFLGDIHYEKLPKFMQSFDIAIIPHKVDEFTASMNPLKLYEYLAAGKPVVTTRVAGVDNISKFVYIANNNDKFIEKISQILKLLREDSINPLEITNSVSKEILWEFKVNQILNYFTSRINK